MKRPDDAELVEVLRQAVAQDRSLRDTLAEKYGCALPTADDWIERARSLPWADLPPARRGRPPGTRNKNRRMTVDEYITNREDMTHIGVVQSEFGWEIVLRLDGSYASREMAEEQAKFVSKTLGIGQ
jgi:transposase